MLRVPVIVGMGGINPAGRTSGHHGYRRLVYEALDEGQRNTVVQALAALRQEPTHSSAETLLSSSLVRALEPSHFDTSAVPSLEASTENGEELFRLREASFPARAAGQLPDGFEPGRLYASRNHPRGLQLAIYAASDALSSLGIPWETVTSVVPPDRIAVYAGAAIAQADDAGLGGLLQSRYRGRRASPKQLPLGLAEMPADFVNAYVLGSFGITGHNVGACSTYLYNLQLATHAIQSGRARVAIAGASEAPLVVDILAGLNAMGALANDDNLRRVQGLGEGDEPDHRSACRPFADNCGMVAGEAAQYAVLFDEQLALELGANMLGSIGGVFVHADGPKKSITGPGVGNYLTLAKCVAEAASIVADIADGETLSGRSYVHAHGTGTPQNRVTESHILSQVGGAFGLGPWPVAAVKAYLGHSMAPAAGDQLAAALGFWREGWIPGITTTAEIADDVFQENLDFVLQHRQIDPEEILVTFLNAKGFGGNNGSASILSPAATLRLLAGRAESAVIERWHDRNAVVAERAAAADREHLEGRFRPRYCFGEGVLGGEDVQVRRDSLTLAGIPLPVDLQLPNPYSG